MAHTFGKALVSAVDAAIVYRAEFPIATPSLLTVELELEPVGH